MEHDTPTDPPSQPAPVRGNKVIQPISDMSEYASSQPAQPAADTPPRPTSTANIYPSLESKPATPAPAASPAGKPQDQKPAPANQRVGSLVPMLQVYAFLIILYSLYVMLPALSVIMSLPLYGRTEVPSTVAPLLFILAVGIAPIYLIIGIYLLLAKSLRVVSALLTALLIISGLSLINTIVNMLRFPMLATLKSFISLGIAIGLFIFLWRVRSEVGLARLEREP